MAEPETDAEDDVPNEHGVCLTFTDDLKEWHWKNANPIVDISATAVREFIHELRSSCEFAIFSSDDGGRIVLMALDEDLIIEAELSPVLRDYAERHRGDDHEGEAFKRMLQDVLKVFDGP